MYVREIISKTFGDMDYFYYLCSMMTKNLYINIVDSIHNAQIANMLYHTPIL